MWRSLLGRLFSGVLGTTLGDPFEDAMWIGSTALAYGWTEEVGYLNCVHSNHWNNISCLNVSGEGGRGRGKRKKASKKERKRKKKKAQQ